MSMNLNSRTSSNVHLTYSHLNHSQLFQKVHEDVHKLPKRRLGACECFSRALKSNKTSCYWLHMDVELTADEESTDDENDS